MAVAHREKFAVVQVVNLAVGRVPDMDMSGCKFLYILRIYMCSSPHLQHHRRVYAPFSGHVVNLNISKGAFARAGADVFTLVDTATWYVVANFRETHLRHI